jgi:hypothetical protein
MSVLTPPPLRQVGKLMRFAGENLCFSNKTNNDPRSEDKRKSTETKGEFKISSIMLVLSSIIFTASRWDLLASPKKGR